MRGILRFAAVTLATAATSVAAQSWQPPTPEQRCPSKWGASDERGAANHMTTGTVCERRAADSAPAR